MSFQPRLAALAALMLIGTAAMAQQPPPPPSVQAPMPVGPAARPLPPGADAEAAGSITLNGRVQQWLLNPNGEIDGLLLADGTQVAFPPHLSASVQQAMKPGDAVQVTGWRTPGAPVLRAASLNANGRSVVDQPPAFGSAPPAPREPGALTAMSASGRVARPLYTGRGDVNGVLLDNGSIVRFPPHVGAELAAALQPGSTLHAKGWGSRGPQGSAIEATAIGPTADGMRELFAGPGMAPPPGPRGARGPAERGPRSRPLPPGVDRPLPPPPAS
ncbi:hypothetical protein [Variovorax guangxiensis]|uniref:Secreted protein n=1 Tax=Variovorax guangxiensis TaxID=1775474 RepID=A0A502DTN7_9BURK|nr:hypothetical protein [Variovorax guangxiensis]RZI66292.1 MAG: hypothetical protein EOP79_08305 [Variovorax sp.]TPG23124.1 hypothetical protein EAH83_13310 [Variovorax ginsengisoli]TPG27672.1 hypothetical protein EAH82_12970 [Variovorax guangxiensis]